MINSMKTFKYIIYSLFLFAFSSCFTDVPLELELSTKKEEAPFTIEIIRNSRQVILTQEKPWEAQSMVYFNVIKNDSIWKMWYNSVGEDIYNDMFGAICYATSYDGKIWYKNIIKKPCYM